METYKIIERKLKLRGAVLIQGVKWCGKTTTAKLFANSLLYMANPEDVNQNISLADINLSILLAGETPKLLTNGQFLLKR